MNEFKARRAKEHHGTIVGGFMVGVVECLDKNLTLPALEVTLQNEVKFNASRASILDSSLDSSNQSRFSGMRNCSVLSPDVEKKRILRLVCYHMLAQHLFQTSK